MATQQTDVAGLALGRLAAQFKGKPNLTALVNAHAKQYQDLEDAFFSIANGRPFPVAQGDALSRWGQTVGQARPTTGIEATDDTVYRRRLQGKIAANVSNGRTVDVLVILSALGATDVTLSEGQAVQDQGAALVFNYTGALAVDAPTLATILKTATGPIKLGKGAAETWADDGPWQDDGTPWGGYEVL
jgi:hypothetical protein